MVGCGPYGSYGRWQDKIERLQGKMDHLRARMNRTGPMGSPWGRVHTSGNRAFDEYRSDTLKRLEEEHKEFHDFLGRLRMAKDKAEFDQFLAERRSRPSSPETQSQA